MDLLEAVMGAKGAGTASAIAGVLGLSEDQADGALGQILPTLAAAMGKNASSAEGAASLAKALATGRHRRFLESPETLQERETVEEGNGILGHLLGSKDVSRALADQVSKDVGLDASVIKKMLPLVATAAMGALSQRAAQRPEAAGSGIDPMELARSLGAGGQRSAPSIAKGLFDLLGGGR